CYDDPDCERARRIRPRRRGTGLKSVGNTGLLIDPLLFVELVAEPIARPLQAQRQAGRPVEDGSAGETRELLQHRLALAHGGAIAPRRRRQALPAVVAANASAERVGG